MSITYLAMFEGALEAGNNAIYNAAQRRIAEVTASQGVATKPGGTPPAPSLIAKAKGLGGIGETILNATPGGNDVKAVIEGSEAVHAGVPGVPSSGELAEGVANDVIGWVKPLATKITLYGLLLFGGVAMMIFGLSEMLKPIGGPDLAGKAKTAGTAALAGAAA